MTKELLYIIIALSFLICYAGATNQLNAQDSPFDVLTTDQEYSRIDQIWTIDNRPDSVEIHWVLPNLAGDVDCRVQRWEVNGSNFTNVTVLSRKASAEDNVYKLCDSAATDTMIQYGYKIWIVQDSNVYVSEQVFTVPRPVIDKYGDYQFESTDLIVSNCLNDTIIVDKIDFEDLVPWHIDSLCVQAVIDSQTYKSSWQYSTDNTCVFNKDFNSDGATHVDSMICEYAVIAKDQTGNTSRTSNSRKAIIDISPPVIGKFSVEPHVDSSDSTSDGSIIITIKNLKDKNSGLKYFQLYRKTAEQTDYELIGHYTTTSDSICIVDLSSNFDKRTLLNYRLKARDNVNNEDIIAESSVRCLLPPEITLAEHETTADSVEIASWNKYDITDVRHFEVMINDTLLDTLISTDCNKIQLPEIGENRIKIRAAFLNVDDYDIVYSEWAEEDTVIRDTIPPPQVKWVKVCHDSMFENLGESVNTTMHEGNLVVKWQMESDFEGSLLICRKSEDGDSTWVAEIETTITTIDTGKWIDKYNSAEWGDHENRNRTPIEPFKFYTYHVYPIDSTEDDTLWGRGESDRNYCNRAPEIPSVVFVPGSEKGEKNKIIVCWEPVPYDDPYCDIKYELRWFVNGLPYSLNEIEKHTPGKNCGETCFKWEADEISVKDTFYFFVRQTLYFSSDNSLMTAWSNYKECIPLRVPPVKVTIQDQPGNERIFLNWEQYSHQYVNIFKVIRKDLTENKSDTTDPIINKFFTDTINASEEQSYLYKVIPGIVHLCVDGKCDTSYYDSDFTKVYDSHSRGYVPVVDLSNFAKRRYFKGDSVCISWFWLDSLGNKIEDPLEFNGADSLWVEISNNRGFNSNPPIDDSMVYGKPVKLNDELDAPSNHTICFEDINDKVNVAATGDFLFISITAFDRWNNTHRPSTYWDSLMYNDSLVFAIRDDNPPYVDSLNFKVRASQVPYPDTVNLILEWERPGDESGTENYTVLIESINGEENEVEFEVGICDGLVGKKEYNAGDNIYINSRSDADTERIIFKYRSIKWPPKNSLVINDGEITYSIKTYDVVGNVRAYENNSHTEYKYFQAPVFDTLYVDSTDLNIVAKWSPVENASSYFIEWADAKKALRSLPAGSCDSTSATIFLIQIDSLKRSTGNSFCDNITSIDWYFHVKAIFQDGNESCWSELKRIKLNGEEISIDKKLMSNSSFVNVPEHYHLNQNYPNPFNPFTKISFGIPEPGKVTIKILNILGNEINCIMNETKSEGFYEVVWDGKDSGGNSVSSGIYFYLIRVNNFKDMKKCVLLR